MKYIYVIKNVGSVVLESILKVYYYVFEISF